MNPETRDAIADAAGDDAAELARQLAEGLITLAAFLAALLLLTRRSMIVLYLLGMGGAALTATDRATIGGLVATQVGYLRDFVAEIGARRKAGNAFTADELANRARLYPESAIEAHSRAQMAQANLDPPSVPPQHPRCRCRLETVTDDVGLGVYWVIQDETACPICKTLGLEMAPWRPKAVA